jgi:lipopolysaccharide export system protein LptC
MKTNVTKATKVTHAPATAVAKSANPNIEPVKGGKAAKVIRMRIVFLSLLLAAIVAFGSWMAISITKNILAENQRQKSSSDFFMDEISFTQMNASGSVESRLQAVKMVHYPTLNTYIFTAPKSMMVDKDGNSWYISGDSGLSTENGRSIYVKDNVVLEQIAKTSQKSLMKVLTSAVTIYPKQKLAETDRPLAIIQGSNKVNAVGAKVDLHTSTVKLMSQVKGKYGESDGPQDAAAGAATQRRSRH